MKTLCPSQYTKVLLDREYSPSGAVQHRRAFGSLGPFHGECSFGVDAALVWVQYGVNSLVFAWDVWMVVGHLLGSSAIDSADKKAGWDP